MATEKASGNNGKVLVGATDLKINQFTRDVMKKMEEVTNSGTAQVGGVITKQQLCVQRWLEGDVNADLDLDVMPHEDPPNLADGDPVALQLYYSANSYDDIPEAHISGLKVTVVVAGKVNYVFHYTSDGTFTLAV